MLTPDRDIENGRNTAPATCDAPEDYPFCDCAHKCDDCNEHLSAIDRLATMETRDDMTCGDCIRRESEVRARE